MEFGIVPKQSVDDEVLVRPSGYLSMGIQELDALCVVNVPPRSGQRPKETSTVLWRLASLPVMEGLQTQGDH